MNRNRYKHSWPLDDHKWRKIKVKVGEKWFTIWSHPNNHKLQNMFINQLLNQ